MRHLWSLLVGVLVAPLAWLVMSIGQVSTGKQFAAQDSTGHFVASDFLPPLLFLVGAGLLLGVLACLRISPLGPLVAGVAYLASYAALLIWPQRTYDQFAYTFHLSFLDGQGNGDLTTPLTSGIAPLLGALLLVAVVSVKRWRRWPVAELDEEVVPVSPVPAPLVETGEPVPAPLPVASQPLVSQPVVSQPVVSQPVVSQPVVVEDEPVGTVVWTREPVESPTLRQPGTGSFPASQPTGSQSTSSQSTSSQPTTGYLGNPPQSGSRARSPWDTPPGEGTDGSQTR